jgi:hypothetical protein
MRDLLESIFVHTCKIMSQFLILGARVRLEIKPKVYPDFFEQWFLVGCASRTINHVFNGAHGAPYAR